MSDRLDKPNLGADEPSLPEASDSIMDRVRSRPLFILPDGSNQEAVHALGKMFLDLTIEALASAERRPPLAGDAGEPPLPEGYEPPREGQDPLRLMQTIREQILPRALNVSHPGYAGHMDTLASAIGAFSDILVSALNNNMLCWEMSPVFTEMEARLLSWFTRAIGWPRPLGPRDPRATGFLVSGGSLANLSALLAARNALCGPAFREKGLAAAPGPPVILASEEVHYSLDKIANILGLGARGLVKIPTDPHMRMDPLALQETLRRLRRNGHWPFCVVGIAGTTVTGAIDPLEEIGEIARCENLWFHVDAAYGGSLLISTGTHLDSARRMLSGIELADSVTFNPQKWLFVPKTCAGIFFRDGHRVADAVRETFPYAGSRGAGITEDRRNVGEYTIQGTRRVDILKLWLTLEHFGRDLLSELMAECLRRARLLAAKIEEIPELELLTPPQLNIVCFRYAPADWDRKRDAEKIDELNRRIHARLEEEGAGWISLPRHRGRRWLRFVILHPLADGARLSQILQRVTTLGRLLANQDPAD